MIEHEITVTVAGHAKTKGSMRCIGKVGKRNHVLIEDHKSTGPWRATLLGWVKQVTRRAEPGQPIGVEATATIVRPKSHYGTGRNATVLKDTAPRHPVGHNTGDVDKLARVYLDVLQDAKVLPDDCQVVELTTRKAYPDNGMPDALAYPGVLLRIYPIAPAEPTLL